MSKVILLVDDDSAFRGSVRDILEIEGYQVIEVLDGKYALPVIEEEHVDLVITDILMPETEGNELAVRINDSKPDMKIIGMTGGGQIGSAETVKNLCITDLFATILKKPFLEEELLTEVVAALA